MFRYTMWMTLALFAFVATPASATESKGKTFQVTGMIQPAGHWFHPEGPIVAAMYNHFGKNRNCPAMPVYEKQTGLSQMMNGYKAKGQVLKDSKGNEVQSGIYVGQFQPYLQMDKTGRPVMDPMTGMPKIKMRINVTIGLKDKATDRPIDRKDPLARMFKPRVYVHELSDAETGKAFASMKPEVIKMVGELLGPYMKGLAESGQSGKTRMAAGTLVKDAKADYSSLWQGPDTKAQFPTAHAANLWKGAKPAKPANIWTGPEQDSSRIFRTQRFAK